MVLYNNKFNSLRKEKVYPFSFRKLNSYLPECCTLDYLNIIFLFTDYSSLYS